MLVTNAPRGTKDILPEESAMWQYIEATIRSICDRFGYKEIRTPVFEHTELFERGVGDTTDVVQKEMYTFNDKGGRSITLKPEGTAGAVRAYLENSVYAGAQPSKLYYITPCFRYEKPQAGRLREFHQFGIEAFGSYSPSIDAEVISMAYLLFKELGIENLEININSIGCPSCRKKYNEALREYFKPHLEELCATCRERYEKNPLRILDCKSEVCKKIGEDAPLLIDHICDECRDHFEKVKGYLDTMGIKYNIDPLIVRGLDYYTKTVFEFKSHNAGSQGTVCGGGRYDGLVEELGGKPTGGIGFGLGLERLVMTLKDSLANAEFDKTPDIFIAGIGEKADSFVEKLVFDLRCDGIKAERDYLERSVKAQMKYADKIGAKYTCVIGDDEIEKGAVALKNMKNGEQNELEISKLGEFLKGDK